MEHPKIIQQVSKVSWATMMLPECSAQQAFANHISSRIEACSDDKEPVVSCRRHPFVAALHLAYDDHRPVVLAPDMFWLLITQGLAMHIHQNSEQLRHRFVNHLEKKQLSVWRDWFTKGSPDNSWEDVLAEFSSQIKDQIGPENHANLVTEFSTTGPVEKAASEIVLMDAVRNYFTFSCYSLCGIPEVHLEGTHDDWLRLVERTKNIGNSYDLTWWTDRLLPTLERIAATAAGGIDVELWENIYKLDGWSGSQAFTGWIGDFFPYLRAVRSVHRETGEPMPSHVYGTIEARNYVGQRYERRNRRFETEKGDLELISEYLPGGLNTAPFTWESFDHCYDMEFVAGFAGLTQNFRNRAIRPWIAWAVAET